MFARHVWRNGGDQAPLLPLTTRPRRASRVPTLGKLLALIIVFTVLGVLLAPHPQPRDIREGHHDPDDPIQTAQPTAHPVLPHKESVLPHKESVLPHKESHKESVRTPSPTSEGSGDEWDGGVSPDERTKMLLKLEEKRKQLAARMGMQLRAPPQGKSEMVMRVAARDDSTPRRALSDRGSSAKVRNRLRELGLPDEKFVVPCAQGDGTCKGTDAPKAKAVVNAMRHVWQGYTSYAWGHDELRPLSGSYQDWGDGASGMGLTLVDSLDTMYLMGLHNEFEEGTDWVADHLSLYQDGFLSIFETTIRVLGGLLSAFTLSLDEALLTKACEVAETLAPAFNHLSTGVPRALFNPKRNESKLHHDTHGNVVLAEVGTLQMEWRLVSWLTGNASFDLLATRVFDVLSRSPRPHGYRDGLLPLYLNPETTRFATKLYSIGGSGDSYYEYLLKQWLMAGNGKSAAERRGDSGKEARKSYGRYQRMWTEALRGIRKWLVGRSAAGKYFVGQRVGMTLKRKMDHLSCFVPGLLALSAYEEGDPPVNDPEDLGWGGHMKIELAEAIMDTCLEQYSSPTGLAPEDWLVMDDEVLPGNKFYILRPETVESLFYLWRVTKKQRYRDAGWKIFQAIENYCKTPFGYAGIDSVLDAPTSRRDQMESFFTAETLKYFYLLFSDDAVLPLDRYVLNTEGHPFPIVPNPPYSLSIFQEVDDADPDETE